MPENIARCHEILTENNVPLKGPFAPLSLSDRITYLSMLLDTFKDANHFLRRENDEILKELDKAKGDLRDALSACANRECS